MMLHASTATATLVACCALMGCDDGGEERESASPSPSEPSSAPSSTTSSRELTISGNEFPPLAPVEPQALVRVRNADRVAHNVVSVDGAFRTPDLAPGAEATFVAPRTPGRYRFTCTLQPGMDGVLTVENSSQASVTPSKKTPDSSVVPTSPVSPSDVPSSVPSQPPPSGY